MIVAQARYSREAGVINGGLHWRVYSDKPDQNGVFRMVKEATDHGSRAAFYRTTGSWPGEKRPDPE